MLAPSLYLPRRCPRCGKLRTRRRPTLRTPRQRLPSRPRFDVFDRADTVRADQANDRIIVNANDRVITNTGTETGSACCCGCDGTPCTFCSSATPISYFASWSGINFQPTGTCSNDGTYSFKLNYAAGGANFGGSVCVSQFVGVPNCQWTDAGLVPSVVNDIVGSISSFSDTICTTLAGTTSHTPSYQAILGRISAALWGFEIYDIDESSVPSGFAIFAGTTAASGTDCYNIGTLSFTNTLAGAGPVTMPVTGQTLAGYASGGTVTVTQKCCFFG